MVVVKLKKEFVNTFHVEDEEELKSISFRVFRGLEDVIKMYENLACKKSSYTDDRSFLALHSSKGEMVYVTNPNEREGRLELKFNGDFDSYQLIGHNRMKIYLYGDTYKINLKIIDDLISTFKSFEKLQKRD